MRLIIKKWFRCSGFGYIEPEEADADVFCHGSDVKSGVDPLEGQKVQFAVVHRGKRSRAEDVYLLN